MISNINKGSHQIKDRTLHLVKRKRMKEHLQFKEQFKSLPWKLINRNWLSQGLGVSVELVLMSRGRHYQIQSPLKRQKQIVLQTMNSVAQMKSHGVLHKFRASRSPKALDRARKSQEIRRAPTIPDGGSCAAAAGRLAGPASPATGGSSGGVETAVDFYGRTSPGQFGALGPCYNPGGQLGAGSGGTYHARHAAAYPGGVDRFVSAM
ncbi:hypothetical protein CB1_001030007 [Camelus ferus]|nr:hypothetical protein CB1_001030007 [Camelus ferus]